ncbi:alpha-tocopherol transfer protein-like [Chironomus tepperi]|uniref:alpha-tocopherol transfer protein-like n=1 Tax=Chironomus tepperi TaxID=113505 RepID=UPI00391EE5DD
MFSDFKKILDSGYSYKKSLAREHVKQESVDLLREKIKNSKIVPKSLTDKQLLRFLTTYKHDINQVVVLIENYYNCKASVPELFQNRDIWSEEIQSALKNQYYIFLPITSDNKMLIFHSVKNSNPSTYDYDIATKVYMMLFEAYNYYYGPFTEAIVLFDLKASGIRFLFKPSVASMRNVAKFVEEAIPVHVQKGIIFNTMKAFDLIISICKQFVKTEMAEKFIFLNSDTDYDKFHQTQIPKSHLPKEFGGTLGTLDELQEKSVKQFMNLRNYFVLEEKQANFEFDDYIEKHPNEVRHFD